MRGYVPPVSFGAVLSVLGIATVIGVGLAVVTHRLTLIPVVIGVALAIGVMYILLTINSPSSDGVAPDPTDTSPFEDPVEEADRLGMAGGAGAAPNPDGSPPTLVFPAPGHPSTADAPVDPADTDPSYDPVVDADRLDSGGGESASTGKDSQ